MARQSVRPVRIKDTHRWRLVARTLDGNVMHSAHTWGDRETAREEAGFARRGLAIGGWDSPVSGPLIFGVRAQTPSRSSAYRSARQAISDGASYVRVVFDPGDHFYTVKRAV